MGNSINLAHRDINATAHPVDLVHRYHIGRNLSTKSVKSKKNNRVPVTPTVKKITISKTLNGCIPLNCQFFTLPPVLTNKI